MSIENNINLQEQDPNSEVIFNKSFEKLFHSVIISFIACSLLFILTHPIQGNDPTLHLGIGKYIVSSGSFIYTDVFSYTAVDKPYLDHEWLSQVLFYGIFEMGGFVGLWIYRIFSVFGAFFILWLMIPKNKESGYLILIFLIPLAVIHEFLRPHLTSWLFTALLTLLFHKRKYYFIPILICLWANMHASFLLALIISSLYFAKVFYLRRDKKIFLPALLTLFAPALNPYGYKIYFFATEIKKYVSMISEWQPLTYDNPFFWVWFIYVLGLIITLAISRKFTIFDLIAAALLIYLGFTAVRHPIVAGIYLFPLFIEQIKPLPPRKPISRMLTGVVTIALSVLIFYFCANIKRSGFNISFDRQLCPVYSSKFIKDKALDGNMFNDYNFGGYFIYKNYPAQKVFVDGRLEVYQGEVLDDYILTIDGKKGWDKVLEKYNIDFIVIRPERYLNKRLLDDPNWEIVYFDYMSLIYAKEGKYPHLKRIKYVSPWKNRDGSKIEESILEIEYILRHNPEFFGGYKILAFLYYRRGNYINAKKNIDKYIEYHPIGAENKEALELLSKLRDRNVF